MQRHNILISPGFGHADMEQSMMNDDSFDDKPHPPVAPRPTAFSMFRQGQIASRAAMALDQKPGTDSYAEPKLQQPSPDRVWESLTPVTLNPENLAGNGLFVNANQSPVTASFDILRTRILQAMEQNGWRRIAITSPTHGCGKSFLAANLALSLARLGNVRTVLMDLELRHPDLARLMGVNAGPIRDVLSAEQPLESHLRRFGKTLALALNSVPVAAAAEMLHEKSTVETLRAMMEHLDPAIAVFDLPPALGSDDVLTLLPQMDAVLLVADGTQTSAEDIRACERLFEGRIPLLGVVLNRTDDRKTARYRYGKK